MRNHLALGLLFFLSFLVTVNEVRAENNVDELYIDVSSSDWRPYVYKEDDVIKGLAYDVAIEVLGRAGVSFRYQILPWARVYRYGLTRKNYLIVGIGRTTEREDLFHWIGLVNKGVDIFFYKLKSNPIKISSIEHAKQYTVAVERDSYYHDFLLLNGFDNDRMHLVMKPEQLLNMTKSNRLPLFLSSEMTFLKEAKKMKLDPSLFEKALFVFKGMDYMAFSKNTSPELVEKVRMAYQELVMEGKIKVHRVTPQSR